MDENRCSQHSLSLKLSCVHSATCESQRKYVPVRCMQWCRFQGKTVPSLKTMHALHVSLQTYVLMYVNLMKHKRSDRQKGK